MKALATAALATTLTLTTAPLGIAATDDSAHIITVKKKDPTLRDARTYARRASRSAGDWRCLQLLWDRESGPGWNHKADNPNSSAYGIAQMLGEKSTNPVTQVKHGLAYIHARYGTACHALKFHYAHGWY